MSNSRYLWLEAATRNEIPLGKGFGVGYFEVGNQKFSLYGRASYSYIYHDDEESTESRSNTIYTQNFEQTSRTDKSQWLGELLFKWQATDNDYFAGQIYGMTTDSKTKQNAFGAYISDVEQSYKSNSSSLDDSNILTSSLYYKHSFAPQNDLEVRLAYNYNTNKYDASRTDFYDECSTETMFLYENSRNSGSLKIDYSKTFANSSSLIIGSHFSFVLDKINNMVDPLFKHRNYNQYIYAGYGGSYKNRLYYNASIGVEGIWAKAGETGYNYIRPRGSASLTWSINEHNSLQFSYELTNTAPAVANLNPYNTSTDSLFVAVGNPDLKPQMANRVSLSYTLNAGNLYVTPVVSYEHINDVIEACGYTRDGVYYSSYANSGHFAQTAAGANISYRFNWGRIYGSGSWYVDYFEEQNAKQSWGGSLGFNAKAQKFSFYGTFYHKSRSYSAISYTQYCRPITADLQVNYNFTPDFYIGVCLQYITGEYRTKTFTEDGSFRSATETRYSEKCFRPWILLRYTLRKNPSKRHKLGKVLNSAERGISITH